MSDTCPYISTMEDGRRRFPDCASLINEKCISNKYCKYEKDRWKDKEEEIVKVCDRCGKEGDWCICDYCTWNDCKLKADNEELKKAIAEKYDVEDWTDPRKGITESEAYLNAVKGKK